MTEPTSGPGQILRAERESLGVTVREVADTLNLSMTVVQALEADDYDRLPGVVFARGYIRAYARLLDLDPVPLLEIFPSQVNGTDGSAAVHEPGMGEWVRRRPGLVLSGLAALVVGLLVIVAVSLWPEEGLQSMWQGSEGPAVAVPPISAGEDWAWSAEAEDAARVGNDPDASLAGPAQSDSPDVNNERAEGGMFDDAAVVEGRAEPEGDGSVRRISDAGDQRLGFQFSADCWVEVRNASGRVLYSNLNSAGSTLELVGQGPFRILLGYAPGVTLAFEGEPVPLAPHTRNNVATLVLGQ